MGQREDASKRANDAMDRGDRATYDDLMECDMDTLRRAQQMERASFPTLAAVADRHEVPGVHSVSDAAEIIDREARALAPAE
jgi:ketosteroid isomerase-like protein